MKKLNILAIILVSTIISCAQTSTPKSQEIENQTPEILQDKKIANSQINYSSKFRYDLIEKLFKEAMNNNEELKSFYKSIDKQHVNRNNQLVEYYKYIQTNEQYWENTNTYINQISDSNLKVKTFKAYELFQKQFQANVKSHKDKVEQITQLTIELNDQIILLKLGITKSMMQNYQSNELLDIGIADDLIKQYEDLITRAKELENQAP